MMVGSRFAQGLVQPPLQLLDSHLSNNPTYSTKLTYQANQKDKSLKTKFVTHQPPPSCWGGPASTARSRREHRTASEPDKHQDSTQRWLEYKQSFIWSKSKFELDQNLNLTKIWTGPPAGTFDEQQSTWSSSPLGSRSCERQWDCRWRFILFTLTSN